MNRKECIRLFCSLPVVIAAARAAVGACEIENAHDGYLCEDTLSKFTPTHIQFRSSET